MWHQRPITLEEGFPFELPPQPSTFGKSLPCDAPLKDVAKELGALSLTGAVRSDPLIPMSQERLSTSTKPLHDRLESSKAKDDVFIEPQSRLYDDVALKASMKETKDEETKERAKDYMLSDTASMQLQISAIYALSSFVIYQTQDKSFDVELSCHVSQRLEIFNVLPLSRLKDRALQTKYTSKDETDIDEFHKYDKFCEFSDIIATIVAHLDELWIWGYPVEVLVTGKRYDCVNGQFEDAKSFNCSIEETRREWEQTLRVTYERNHLLTFFYGQQFWNLEKHFFEGTSLSSSSLLEYIGLSGQIKHNQIRKTDVADRLNEIGEILSDLNAHSQLLQYKEKQIPQITYLGETTREPGSVFLTICLTSLHAWISAYLLTQRKFPQHYQVMFCSEKTSQPEILAFVYRFFTDPEPNLYSLVSCENLDTENQVLFIQLFEKLIVKGDHHFQLSIISNTTRGSIIEYFQSTKRVEVVRVKDVQRIHLNEDLAKIVKSIDPNTFVYWSERAGFGKSTQIEMMAKSVNKKVLKFSIAGDLSMDEIGERLLTKTSTDMLLHINLGYVENCAGLNQFLMNLSMFRMVKSNDLIVCLPKETIICIELPNLQPSLADSLPYLQLLYSKKVEFEFNLNVTMKTEELLAEYKELSTCCEIQTHRHSETSSQAELLKCLFNQTIGEKATSFIRFRSFLNMLTALLINFKQSPFSDESVNEMIQDLQCGNSASSKNNAMLIREYRKIRSTIVESFLETTKEATVKYTEDILLRQESALSKDSNLQQVMTEYKIQSWDASNRFVMLFLEEGSMLPICKKPKSITDDVIPLNIKKLIFLQTKSDEMTERQMATAIQRDFEIDYYEDFSSEKLREKLLIYCSRPKGYMRPEESLYIEDKEYVLTSDNFFKMNLIYLRAMAMLPIIIMGEIGCGKTSLIRFFVNNVLREYLYIVSIHAGFDSKQLAKKIEEITQKAKEFDRIWVFFDEFNTSVCIGQICEIMCERSFQGDPLPDNIVMLGACNPYRMKTIKHDEEVGIKKAQNYINDLSNTLEHVVKPLPETMIEFVWDFGALTDNDMRKYMEAMLGHLGFRHHFDIMINMLFVCQSHWKRLDPNSVSMRDVKRFTMLYKWFYESLEIRKKTISVEYKQNVTKLRLTIEEEAVQDCELSAGILSLCYCYYLRISKQEERGSFLEEMATASRDTAGKVRVTSELIRKVLRFNEDDLIARMKLPEGTALNTAFRENICTLFPCIYSGVAVFICGKPGCSKSLAVQVLFDNCKGRNSSDPYFRSLKELIRVSIQGSESCTSKGVENAFEKAEKILNVDRESYLPVVVFDKIGLAEISPYNPLKVLHSNLELENRDIAFIGISNWRLDASKMNRALYLARPEPVEDELQITALNLYEAIHIKKYSEMHFAIIVALTKTYSDFRNMLKDTPFKEFYGLRDFYNLIKLTSRFFKAKPDLNYKGNAILCKTAILRNFGGLRDVSAGFVDYSELFYQILKRIYRPFSSFSDAVSFYSMTTNTFKDQRATALDLVQENMHDELSRYLMIISNDDAALFVLERALRNLPSDKKKVIVGSHMLDDDDAKDYGFCSLSNVLLHMENGTTLILKDMNNIYTTFYDLFNQNFSRVGSRNYCRVAIGAQFNRYCFVHDEFRIVILMDDDANKLTQMDAPFLNRFEKQRFNLDLLVPDNNPLLSYMAEWMKRLMTPIDPTFKPIVTESQVFPLFTQDFLKLLVLFSDETLSLDSNIQLCKEKLIRIASADFLILCKLSSFEEWEQNEAIEQWYRLHDLTFSDLLDHHVNQLADEPAKLVVFTFDNSTQFPEVKFIHKHFSQFHSEKEFIFDLKTFLNSNNLLYILEINLDSSDSTHLTFIKFTIDNIVKKNMSGKIICLLVRLRRVAKRNVSLCWFEGWEQITFENLSRPFAKSLSNLHTLLGASTLELIQNREIFDFEEKIEAITQETYLKFQREFPLSFPEKISSLHMLEIDENNRKKRELVKALKEIVLNQIIKQRYVVANWKTNVLSLEKYIEGPADMESAIRAAIENEVTNAYTQILYAVERRFGFLSYFTESLKNSKATQRRLIEEIWMSIIATSEEILQSIAKLEENQALNTGEDFLQLNPGLSLTSICFNTNCRAYGKVILVPKGFDTFDLSESIMNLICPTCNCTQTQEAMSALFYMAKWRIKAFKNEGDKQSSFALANIFGYKELNQSNSAYWKILKVQVEKLSTEDLELEMCFRPLRTEVGKAAVTGLTCVLSITPPLDESNFEEKKGGSGGIVICVIDESSSMDEDRIDKVKKSLTILVNKIPQGDRVALVCFNKFATMRCPLTADKNRLRQAISCLKANGGKNITVGVAKALEVLDFLPHGESASILLLSDGGDSGATCSKEIIESYRRRGKEFTLHTLGCGDQHQVEMMTTLARFGKGTYTSVRETKEIENAITLFIGAAVSKFARSFKVHFMPSSDILVKTVYGKSDVNQFAVSDLSFDRPKDMVFKVDLPTRSLNAIAPLKAVIDYTLACVSGSTAARRREITLNLRCKEDTEEKDDDSVLEQLDRVEASISIGEARRLATAGNFANAFNLLEQTRIALSQRPETEQRKGIIDSLEKVKEKVRDLITWSVGGEKILEDIENNLMEQTASINAKLFMNSAQLSMLGALTT